MPGAIPLVQVLVFVLNYVQRHELSKATVHALFECIRLPYLSNERLAQLSQVGTRPRLQLQVGSALYP
jgi:hypothetical protein